MPSQFEAIAAAVKTRLETDPAVCPSIVRSRNRPVAEQNTQAVVIHLRSSEPNRGAILGAPVDWTTRIEVECYATGTSPGDSAVDALLLSVHDRLLADKTLAGTADDVYVEDIAWETEAQAANAGCATLTLGVLHRTASNTLA